MQPPNDGADAALPAAIAQTQVIQPNTGAALTPPDSTTEPSLEREAGVAPETLAAHKRPPAPRRKTGLAALRRTVAHNKKLGVIITCALMGLLLTETAFALLLTT